MAENMYKSGAERDEAEAASRATENSKAATESERFTKAGGYPKEKKASGMPKQRDGEDSASYGQRLREWRSGAVSSAMDAVK